MRGAALAVKAAIDPADSREGSQEPGDVPAGVERAENAGEQMGARRRRPIRLSLELLALVDAMLPGSVA
jgi:hypothetical protein